MKGFECGDRTRQLVDRLSETTGWVIILPNLLGEKKVGLKKGLKKTGIFQTAVFETKPDFRTIFAYYKQVFVIDFPFFLTLP